VKESSVINDEKILQKFAIVIALVIATVAVQSAQVRRRYRNIPDARRRYRDVSHLQLKDENGYLYPAPSAPFPPPVNVEVNNEYLPPPEDYLPPQ
jgi:hypothetical protein